MTGRARHHALDELGEEIAAVSARIDAAQYRLLLLIREFDEEGGWAQQGALTCAHWLSWRIGLAKGAAREKVRVARALKGLPLVEEGLRKGQLSYSKVRAITRVAVPENEATLVEYAKHATGHQMERIVRGYKQVLVRNELGYIPEPNTDRWVRTWRETPGMVRIEAQLTVDEAEIVLRALDRVRYAGNEAAWKKEREAEREMTSSSAPAGDVPAETSSPLHGDVPAEASNPLHGDVPAETSSPLNGDVPAETSTPLSGDVPAETSNPLNGDVPAEASTPLSGGVPAETSSPLNGDVPAEISSPLNGDVPAETSSPLNGDVPAETSSPLNGDVPAETSSPLNGDVPAETERPPPAPSPRQSFYHRADALVAIAASVLDAPHMLKRPASPHLEVTILVDADSLQGKGAGTCTTGDGHVIPVETAQRLACDGPIVPALIDSAGDVLDVGRRTRSIPPSLRRALRLRDKGCRFPGCTHHVFVDGHHVQHWAHGGETKIDNLVLLCKHHHRLVHEGGYQVEMVDGEPIFRSPSGSEIPQVPPAPVLPRETDSDPYPGFLSWLDAQPGADELIVPEGPASHPWDFELCVAGLCQDYVGPVPQQHLN